MSFTYDVPQGNSNGSLGYRVLSATSTTYKVNFTGAVSTQQTNETISVLMWIQKDGTIVATEFQGVNETGSGEYAGFLTFLSFETFTEASTAEFSQSQYFHVADTGTTTITGTQLHYTDIQANTLPETESYCGSAPETITKFSLRLGTPVGTNYLLIISGDFGTESNGSASEVILQITQLTLA